MVGIIRFRLERIIRQKSTEGIIPGDIFWTSTSRKQPECPVL
jgi:hypothetical protein